MEKAAAVAETKPAEAAKPAVKPVEKPAAAATQGNKIENILPLDLKDKMEIRIMTSSPVKYKTTELASPPNPRILIQLINCDVKGSTKAVDKSNVGKIRTAPHSSTAWVVIDLMDKQRWDITQSGSTLSVNIPKGGAASAPPSAEKTTAEPAHKTGNMMYRVIDVAGKNLLKKTRVIITTDGPVKYRVKKDTAGKFLDIGILDAVSTWQKDSVEIAQGTVTKISLSENAGAKEVNVRLNMSENAPYTVTRDQNQIIVDVDNAAAGNKKVKRSLDLYQRISLNIQDATLTSVLRLLSTQTGFEFSVAPGAATAATLVTIREDDQTLDKVLKDILVPQGIYYELSDGIIRVGTTTEIKAAKALRPKITKFYTPRDMDVAALGTMVLTTLSKEPLMDVSVTADPSKGANRLMLVGTREDIDKAMDVIAGIDSGGGEVGPESDSGGRFKTKVFKLENVRLQVDSSSAVEATYLSELSTTLKNMISADGSFSIDRRTSSIVVTETVPNLKKIEKLIKSLDVRVPQVSIEAKLYEVDVNAEKDMGVRWTVANQDTHAEPYINGDSLVGSVGSGITGGNLNVGTLQNGFKVNASISALESRNKATLLSAPKVAVETDQPANIITVRSVYYAQQTTSITNGVAVTTTDYQKIDLPIALKVWCKVSKDGFINMRVDVQVSKIVPTNRTTGPPDTTIQQASTVIKARNDETVVIGGLINENLSDVEEKVPLLGDLPLIGALFRGTKKTTEKVEIVVFLTPSIVEE